jgi:hypothetical protein
MERCQPTKRLKDKKKKKKKKEEERRTVEKVTVSVTVLSKHTTGGPVMCISLSGTGVPRGVVWGVQTPPLEIPKFRKSWAKFPVPWNIRL